LLGRHVEAVEVPLPGAIFSPAVRGLHGSPWSRSRIEQFERESEDTALRIKVERLAARVPKREVAEYEPGDSRGFDEIFRAPKDHRGDAVRFEVPGRQTDGLVADRSGGDKDGRIDTVLAGQGENLGRISLDGEALTAEGRDRVEAFVQVANAPIGGSFFRPVQR